MKPDPSIRKTWRGARGSDPAAACGCGWSGVLPTVSSTLPVSIVVRGQRRRPLSAGSAVRGRRPAVRRYRAVDIKARAIRALDPSGGHQVQIDPRMAERPAVAGDHLLLDIDGFERCHGPESLQPTGRPGRLTGWARG